MNCQERDPWTLLIWIGSAIFGMLWGVTLGFGGVNLVQAIADALR